MSEIESKVLNWVNSQGYPLEMHCQGVLKRKGYNCSAGNYYFDQDLGKQREIDLSCFITKQIESRYVLQFNLEIECKYAKDKPWVMFINPNDKQYGYPGAGVLYSDHTNYFFGQFYREESWSIEHKKSPILYPDYIGYGLTQSLKQDRDDEDRSYKSIMTALKSSLHSIKRVNKDPLLLDKILLTRISLPIVVMDGLLYGCLLENGVVAIKKMEYGVLRWNGDVEVNGRPFIYVVT